MKIFLTTLLVLCSIGLFAQSQQLTGNYRLVIENKEEHLFEFDLSLNQDGTFNFQHHSIVKNRIPTEENIYGKGKWIEKNNMIQFITNSKNDIDQKFTLDFSNSKARFITKSPRDKSDRVIATSLRFIESDIFWMKGVTVIQ